MATRRGKSGSKRLLITGGASGIGAATARLAVKHGHQVMIADVNASGARSVARSIGRGASSVALDITSEPQWEKVLDEVWSRFGGLDVLVSNAATVVTGNAIDVPIRQHHRMIDVNYLGTLKGMLAAVRRFQAQGSGHLVTVCSMTAFLPFPGIATYAAGKHALRAFHHALSIELRESPLHFTIVHPTSVETPMLEQEARDDAVAMAFARPAVTPQFVAKVILEAMDRRAIEVFMPPERARFVRLVGTNPKELRKLVVDSQNDGKNRQLARRRRLLKGAVADAVNSRR
jgi:NAD(P)-dependent dehydrogenase (short-subunit alcohol dehydrogenase family)